MAGNKACLTRLQKEYKTLLKEPVPHITAHPSSNLLEWHYVLEGAAGTDYSGGVYHGKIVFPAQYPFKPPSISLFTPTGRFAVNTKLCLSMTDYHPESWNPMWSVGTILTGLLSFMVDPQQTTGSITSTTAEKQVLAKASLPFNMKNPTFRKMFPEWCEQHEAREAAAAAAATAGAAAAAATAQQPGAAQQQQQQQGGGGGGSDRGVGEAGTRGAVGATQPVAAAATGARAGGGGGGGSGGLSSGITLAVVLILVAIAVAPLLSGKGGLRFTGGGS
ncbi:hypothetical protein FOA52_011325 [Chlamydomonas sp. UWO 241]|nr:hypothetical protein FOA52_011325 [Chlamydomonas sp. UWO 241]